MPVQPPKITFWSERAVSDSPDYYAVRPSVPSAWRYFNGAIGYWLPHALNQSRDAVKAIKQLR